MSRLLCDRYRGNIKTGSADLILSCTSVKCTSWLYANTFFKQIRIMSKKGRDMIIKEQLIRTINVMKPGEVDFFLGAGASVNSGIPSGGDLVWYFKRLIYCNENHVSVEKYKDLYDTLQNTSKELQALETAICDYWKRSLMSKGLVVVGYSGNDNSIMNFLEENTDHPDFISKGLYWTVIKDGNISPRVGNLILKAREKGKIAEIVETEGFDDLLYDIYRCTGLSNTLIEEQWRTRMDAKKPLMFTQSPVQSFIKLNAFPIVEFPKCKVFKTDITKWGQLRECIGGERIVAALFKGHIYSFDCEDDLQKVFTNHIKSEISEEAIETHILRRHNSIYIGMLYDLIEQHLKSKGFVRYAKNRYYLPNTQKNEKGLLV